MMKVYLKKQIKINKDEKVSALSRAVRLEIYKAIIDGYKHRQNGIPYIRVTLLLNEYWFAWNIDLSRGLCIAFVKIALAFYSKFIVHSYAVNIFPELKKYEKDSSYWFSSNEERIEALKEMINTKSLKKK